MTETYFRGVFAAYLGTGFISGPVSEWQINMIKEGISRYHESLIEHSSLSDQEKEEKKRQMKQSLEVYIHGVKDMLSSEGRLVSDDRAQV